MFSLNSHDVFDPNLPMDTLRAQGGTTAMWEADLDPYITVLSAPSTPVLPLMLYKPGFLLSIHVGLYLPTGGRKQDFSQAIADLTGVVESAIQDYPGVSIYLRGMQI